MSRPQLNIRSEFARARARELAERMGMTVTQVVEDALRQYAPAEEVQPVGSLVRSGPLLVWPATGRKYTRAQTNAAIIRSRIR